MSGDLVKAIYAALIAFAINVLICPLIIPSLKKLKLGQYVRSDGPSTHLVKAGTPTMGGIMIIISILFACIFFVRNNAEALMVLFVSLSYGLIGFLDDYTKVAKKRSLGLTAMQKIVCQLVITTIFVFYMYRSGNDYTRLFIPFTNGKTLNLGLAYIPFVYFIIIGTVNSVNLTDGLDGLASGVTALVNTFFFFAACALNSPIAIINGAAVGALLGFLVFNSHPARVMMGDTGSFALGGFVAATAIILRMPLFLAIVGIIYVAEALSVILQVSYFKKTGGKRLFKMAPLHHHFEKSGWEETRVVALFYIVTAIACLIGFISARGVF